MDVQQPQKKKEKKVANKDDAKERVHTRKKSLPPLGGALGNLCAPPWYQARTRDTTNTEFVESEKKDDEKQNGFSWGLGTSQRPWVHTLNLP